MSCNEVAPPARISAMIGAILLATRSLATRRIDAAAAVRDLSVSLTFLRELLT